MVNSGIRRPTDMLELSVQSYNDADAGVGVACGISWNDIFWEEGSGN
jgi:hypothetical protein